MKGITVLYILLVFILVKPLSVFAKENTGLKDIKISYLRDYSGDLLLTDVLKRSFTRYNKEQLSVSNGNVFWLKLLVQKEDINNEHFAINFGHWAYVDFYTTIGGDWQKRTTGKLLPINNRDIVLRNQSLANLIIKNDTIICYARLEASTNHIQLVNGFNISVVPYENLLKKETKNIETRSFINGFYICMFVFLVFLYILTRDKGFLYCSFYFIFLTYTNINNSGELQSILWFLPQIPIYIAKLDVLATAGTAITGILTIIQVFDFDKNFPKEKVVYRALIILFSLFIPLVIFVKHTVFIVYSIYACMPLLLLLTFYISIKALFLRLKFALIFSIANIIFFCGFIFYILSETRIITTYDGNDLSMMKGALLQSFILALIFSSKYDILRKENDEKQMEIIKKLKENENVLKKWQEVSLKAESLEREKAISQYEALKNQISPHFLFNSLNVLSQLIYESKDGATLFIKKLSDLYRYILDHRNKPVVYLEDEVKSLKSYVFLLKIRFLDSLFIDIDVSDEQKSQYMLPPLVLQMLIENAVKHNQIDSNNPLYIKVYINKHKLYISNSIAPREIVEHGTKMGLENIKSRYEMITNEKLEIIINNQFTVILPILIDD